MQDLKLSFEDHIKSLNLHTINMPLTFFNEKTLIENQVRSLLNSDGVTRAKHQYLLEICLKYLALASAPIV